MIKTCHMIKLIILQLKIALFGIKNPGIFSEHLPVSLYRHKLNIIVWQLLTNLYISMTKTKPLQLNPYFNSWEKHGSLLVETWAYVGTAAWSKTYFNLLPLKRNWLGSHQKNFQSVTGFRQTFSLNWDYFSTNQMKRKMHLPALQVWLGPVSELKRRSQIVFYSTCLQAL